MLLAIILGPLMEEYLRRAVTVGDFNADGLSDLAVANGGSGEAGFNNAAPRHCAGGPCPCEFGI